MILNTVNVLIISSRIIGRIAMYAASSSGTVDFGSDYRSGIRRRVKGPSVNLEPLHNPIIIYSANDLGILTAYKEGLLYVNIHYL
jgi:hypothetical protein